MERKDGAAREEGGGAQREDKDGGNTCGMPSAVLSKRDFPCSIASRAPSSSDGLHSRSSGKVSAGGGVRGTGAG